MHFIASLLAITLIAASSWSLAEDVPRKWFDEGTLMALLRKPPFQAKVQDKLLGFDQMKLVLGEGSVAMTFKQQGDVDQWTRKVLLYLEVGKEYDFPQAIKDALGPDVTAALMAIPGPQDAPQALSPAALLALRSGPPFLASVEDNSLLGGVFTLRLAEDSQKVTLFTGTATEEHQRVLAYLKKGTIYEFPDAIRQALLPEAERRNIQVPLAPNLKPLNRYIGRWIGNITDHPEISIQMRCLWRADARGLWRILTTRNATSQEPPFIEAAIIEYDDAKSAYRITVPAEPDRPAIYTDWDEPTLTFTSKVLNAEAGETKINRATFSGQDRIDWRTDTMSNTAGSLLGTTRGIYARLNQP
jgi:hypothetical protein